MTNDTASRLCAACGMCCNGVLFHCVHLQPDESPQALKTLGVQFTRKKNQYSLLQPCTAHRGNSCSVYEHRPLRCRQFNCKQLIRVEEGEVTEAEAMTKILQAKEHYHALLTLLPRLGSTNRRRSLATRYEKAMAQPIHLEFDPESAEVRSQILHEMEALEKILEQDFRVGCR